MRRAGIPSSGISRPARGSITRSSTMRAAPSRSASVVGQQEEANDPDEVTNDSIPGSNIRVIARCRGRNDREIKANSAVVVDTTLSKTEVSVCTNEDLNTTKVFSLDRVFGPEADQNMIYDEVISPIVDDCLAGLNCTVFAYGQTGTGKTYTMSGDDSLNYNTHSHDAGIIPRVLFQIFNSLDLKSRDYMVSCSFIELYNEELRDLLSDDDSKKVRIFDDQAKKCVTVSGLNEIYVNSAISGLEKLREGLQKRQVAATKMNDHSSRSHSIFTLTVVTNHNSEFAVKSKINLVDLAGSENIGKSGAENERAREAGMINQSLLTLGRVINSLVDKSSHIPYRESKLTRLLQDSLGGRTKTCIIATISPALVNIEESLSTLEYASRAKSIKNKPQTNTFGGMKTTLKECSQEMEKLQNDLAATRKKNGIYLDENNYKELMAEIRSQKIVVRDQQRKLEAVEAQLKVTREQQESLRLQLLDTTKELQNSKSEVIIIRSSLETTLADLDKTRQSLRQETALRKAHAGTEGQLHAIGGDLIRYLEQADRDSGILHDKLGQVSDYDSTVNKLVKASSDHITGATVEIKTHITNFDSVQNQIGELLGDQLESVMQKDRLRLEDASNLLQDSLRNVEVLVDNLLGSLKDSQSGYDEFLDSETSKIRTLLVQMLSEGLQPIRNSSQEMIGHLESKISQTEVRLNGKLSDALGKFESLQAIYKKQVESQLVNVEEQGRGIRELVMAMNEKSNSKATELGDILARESAAANARRRAFAASINKAVEDYSRTDVDSSNTVMNRVGEILRADNDLSGLSEGILRAVSKSANGAKSFLQNMAAPVNELENLLNPATGKLIDLSGIRAAAKDLGDLGTCIEENIVSAKNNAGKLDGFIQAARGHNHMTYQQLSDNARQLSSKIQSSFEYLTEHLTALQNGGGNEEVDQFVKGITEKWQQESRGALRALEVIHQSMAGLNKDVELKSHEIGEELADIPERQIHEFSKMLPHTSEDIQLSPMKNSVKLTEPRQPLEELGNSRPTLPENTGRKLIMKPAVPIIPQKRQGSSGLLPKSQRRHL